VHPFNGSVDAFKRFLTTVSATGGKDGPEDYVGAIQKILNLDWRPTARHGIVWIADAPAHGRRFCGYDNHQEEEAKLEPLVKQLAGLKTTFRGFSLDGGASVTFEEMEKIYKATDPTVSFLCVKFDQRARDFAANVKALGQFVTKTLSAGLVDFFSDAPPPARKGPVTDWPLARPGKTDCKDSPPTSASRRAPSRTGTSSLAPSLVRFGAPP
jgi:hypothetical protein